jgi:mannose-6-phosphate isomerase-like protein (cupin superfamily)
VSRADERAESAEETPGFSLLPIARIDLGFEESVLVYHAIFGAQSVPVKDTLSHRGEEIIRNLKGSIKVEVGAESYSLNEGDALRLPASSRHRAMQQGRGAAEAIWIISPSVPRE